jgi:hypothetical protein
MEKMITVAIVEPNQPARIEVIENTLEAKQAIVGGRIEVLGYEGFDIVFNEEGKFEDLEPNFGIFGGRDYIAGTAIFMGSDYESGQFISLSDEQKSIILMNFSERR